MCLKDKGEGVIFSCLGLPLAPGRGCKGSCSHVGGDLPSSADRKVVVTRDLVTEIPRARSLGDALSTQKGGPRYALFKDVKTKVERNTSLANSNADHSCPG